MAEYKFTVKDDGSKKCSFAFKSPGKKLNVEKIFAGEGVINIQYFTKDVDPALTIAAQSGRPVKHIWHFDAYLAKDTPAQYTIGESAGETLEVTLGETAESKLFASSGFVNGELVGVIRAPAVHLRMMGMDIWAFMIYFENALSGDNALKFEKSSLSVIHDSSNATAELRTDYADKRKLIVTLNSTGTDFKKLRVNLTRITPSGDKLVEQLGEFGKDNAGPKELSWAPVSRTGAELLWVFPTSIHGRHGALKDAIEQLGAKVNRSVFADGYGRRQMDDFILADGEKMNYRIELAMEHHFEIRGPTRGYLLTDSTTMKYVRLNAARKTKTKNASVPVAEVRTHLANDASKSADLETKICTHCGSKIAQSAKFCSHCGQMQQEQAA
ncbi:MAG: zinc ribbon domain-containing protein [Thaumarchaeota archaeon]|nr:zinc ribbon domain-containing protein [Nitrososphaerota archaeon]